jgi:hypothetical protein
VVVLEGCKVQFERDGVVVCIVEAMLQAYSVVQ